MKELAKKAINFDLDTKKMANYMNDSSQGYHALERSFKRQNFEHDQGSGYVSKEPITNNKLKKVLVGVVKENPWLPDCARRFRITEPTVLYEGELLLNKIGSQLSEGSSAAATVAPQTASVASPALTALRAGYKPKNRTAVIEREDKEILE